jgi:hypothetical protein
LGGLVLKAVIIIGTLFWNVTPCSLVDVYQRFAGLLLAAGCFFGLFFDSEDGGNMFL